MLCKTLLLPFFSDYDYTSDNDREEDDDMNVMNTSKIRTHTTNIHKSELVEK